MEILSRKQDEECKTKYFVPKMIQFKFAVSILVHCLFLPPDLLANKIKYFIHKIRESKFEYIIHLLLQQCIINYRKTWANNCKLCHENKTTMVK